MIKNENANVSAPAAANGRPANGSRQTESVGRTTVDDEIVACRARLDRIRDVNVNFNYEVPRSPIVVRQGLAAIERGHLIYTNTGLARIDCDLANLANVTVHRPSPRFERAVTFTPEAHIYEIVGNAGEQSEQTASSAHDHDLGAAAPPAGDDSGSGGDGEQQQQQQQGVSVLCDPASVDEASGASVGSAHPVGVGATPASVVLDGAGATAEDAVPEHRTPPITTSGTGASTRRQSRSVTRRPRGPRELPPRRAPSSRVAARRRQLYGGDSVDVDPLVEDLGLPPDQEVSKTVCWIAGFCFQGFLTKILFPDL